MKTRELFVFYSTLAVPIGAAAGFAIGRAIGYSTVPVICGVVLGFVAAYLMTRGAAPAENSK